LGDIIQRMHKCTKVDPSRNLGDSGFGWKMPVVLCSYKKPTTRFILLRSLEKGKILLLHNWSSTHTKHDKKNCSIFLYMTFLNNNNKIRHRDTNVIWSYKSHFLTKVRLGHYNNIYIPTSRTRPRVAVTQFDVTKLQKLWGNEIRPEGRSTGTFPFTISSNWCENISADRSFCSWTRIFVVNFNVFTCRHKVEYFRQAFISSAGVDRGITGNVTFRNNGLSMYPLPGNERLCWFEVVA
jgi:hypothetical protein